jgi:hypothetical protein
LGAGLDATPGLAIYTTLAWGAHPEEGRWDAAQSWLRAALSIGPGFGDWSSLMAVTEPASAGLEGSSPVDARAKVYVRLRRPLAFSLLGHEAFTEPTLLRFVELTGPTPGIPQGAGAGSGILIGNRRPRGHQSGYLRALCAPVARSLADLV